QPLHNRITALWAAACLPEALTADARKAILEEIWKKQEPDGGWSKDSMGPYKKREAAPASAGSNAYATALTAFVLQRAGLSNPGLTRALDWLRTHQDREAGFWDAMSMNKKYPPDSMQIRFMRDAATGFATLALLEAGGSGKR